MTGNLEIRVLPDILAALPETLITITLLAVIVYDLFLGVEKSARTGWLAAAGLTLAFVTALYQWFDPVLETQLGIPAFTNLIVTDRFALFFKLIFCAASVIVIFLALTSAELGRMRAGEFYTMLLTATLASCFLVSSTNMLMLYLAIETLSIPSYVLAGYRKGVRQSAEASLKYVLFGAVASGVMVYGLSLLYGLAGSLDYSAIARIAGVNYPAFVLTMTLIIAGFGFKMSLVPFHFWAPDVYEGAPTPITAYLAVVSKAAGAGAFLRFLAPYFTVKSVVPYTDAIGIFAQTIDLRMIFALIAIATMTVGNLAALKQTDIKRLLAYSSIAHAGYILTAFVAGNPSGFSSVLFYLIVYIIANLGLFAAAIIIHNGIGTYRIDEYRGLFFRSPLLALCAGVMLWSLIGLPPSAGFVGKFKLFYSVILKGQVSSHPMWYYAVVLVALLNSVISLYYYIRIVRIMCFYQPETRSERFAVSRGQGAAMLAFAVPILLIQLYWLPITRFSAGAMNMTWQQLETASAAPRVPAHVPSPAMKGTTP